MVLAVELLRGEFRLPDREPEAAPRVRREAELRFKFGDHSLELEHVVHAGMDLDLALRALGERTVDGQLLEPLPIVVIEEQPAKDRQVDLTRCRRNLASPVGVPTLDRRGQKPVGWRWCRQCRTGDVDSYRLAGALVVIGVLGSGAPATHSEKKARKP